MLCNFMPIASVVLVIPANKLEKIIMLKRILTAVVLIPIFVLLLFKLSPKAFCLLTAIIVLWAAWEWSFLMGVKQLKYSFIYPVILFFLLAGSMWLYIPGVIIGTFIWWLVALLFVLF